MSQNEKKVCWLSFTLQCLLGLILGPIIGLVIISPRGSGIWLDDELILPFLIGMSLVFGGIGSKYGNRLWLRQSAMSSLLSRYVISKGQFGVCILLFSLGACLVVGSLIQHFLA